MRQSIVVPSGAPPLDAPTTVDRAGRWLWFALAFMLISVSIGLNWDRAWHAQNKFETFYSPPHVFIYCSTIITILLVAAITFSAQLRPWFGTAFRMRLFTFPVPGALVITAGGLAMLGFAGLVLDNYWHTNFGLDETNWSTPHAMLGWSWFVAMLGFISCRLALRPYRPLRWFTAIALGWLILGFSATPFLGPFHTNTTPAKVEAQSHAIATFPALANNTGIEHVQRIFRDANLTRTNPAFLLLAALWIGVVLALVRRLDGRAWVFLATVGLFSFSLLTGDHAAAVRLDTWLPISHDAATWLPPPIFPAAVAFVLARRFGLRERWAWAVAGAAFAILTYLTWGTGHPLTLLLVPVVVPVTMAGAWLGNRIARMLENPVAPDVRLIVPLLGVTSPLLLGLVDLYLRKTIA
ncbi:MAG TPA: hypothetical protein VIG44_06885 [Thermomicrobiales bacterium]